MQIDCMKKLTNTKLTSLCPKLCTNKLKYLQVTLHKTYGLMQNEDKFKCQHGHNTGLQNI